MPTSSTCPPKIIVTFWMTLCTKDYIGYFVYLLYWDTSSSSNASCSHSWFLSVRASYTSWCNTDWKLEHKITIMDYLEARAWWVAYCRCHCLCLRFSPPLIAPSSITSKMSLESKPIAPSAGVTSRSRKWWHPWCAMRDICSTLDASKHGSKRDTTPVLSAGSKLQTYRRYESENDSMKI